MYNVDSHKNSPQPVITTESRDRFDWQRHGCPSNAIPARAWNSCHLHQGTSAFYTTQRSSIVTHGRFITHSREDICSQEGKNPFETCLCVQEYSRITIHLLLPPLLCVVNPKHQKFYRIVPVYPNKLSPFFQALRDGQVVKYPTIITTFHTLLLGLTAKSESRESHWHPLLGMTCSPVSPQLTNSLPLLTAQIRLLHSQV